MKKKIKEHYSNVANLGCIACRKMGYYDTPAEIHHIQEKYMLGKKANWDQVIPLCPAHHRTTDYSFHFSPKRFTEQFGTQTELLEETRALLCKG
tara:strand:+ start:1107 stop:1388 length:282 start_codon:yes stop_codon:yes gene_type:complete